MLNEHNERVKFIVCIGFTQVFSAFSWPICGPRVQKTVGTPTDCGAALYCRSLCTTRCYSVLSIFGLPDRQAIAKTETNPTCRRLVYQTNAMSLILLLGLLYFTGYIGLWTVNTECNRHCIVVFAKLYAFIIYRTGEFFQVINKMQARINVLLSNF